jgi:hypothetical protein
MEPLDQIVNTISLTMGVAWASGISLYAAILVLGLLGITENIFRPGLFSKNNSETIKLMTVSRHK